MNGNDNNAPQYPYSPYYYPQCYPNHPQQQQQHHVPQGDPSAALSSMVYQLQQQTQQRQAMGALAAASISSVLGSNRHQGPHSSVEYYSDYFAVNDQRPMINYNDISQTNACSLVSGNAASSVTNEPDPSPKNCNHMCLKSVLEEHEEAAHGKERKENNKKPSRPDGVVPPNAPKISTPEELEAWIAARKKNWPSKDNIERKQQENAEKEARGELLPGKKRKSDVKNTSNEQRPKKKNKSEQLSLVAAQYDSNSDSDDLMDLEKDAISSKDPSAMGKILLPEDRPKRRCKYFMMGNCKRGDDCGFSHEKSESKPKQPKQPRSAPAIRKKPNLLFKLLEKEIMQEKSVILQCLRYIVDNKFFGKDEQQSVVEDATFTMGHIAPVAVNDTKHSNDQTSCVIRPTGNGTISKEQVNVSSEDE
ncbi:hypothetical protein [Parasitella parasitica]|uniref:C3H1-type domain-containing protein n=1 Tax=Parasitella parasitica TaxID=35722 RepID=A0A0B7NGB0_9FUNG|nr:hypothetical protein [Parasitella parasitica]